MKKVLMFLSLSLFVGISNAQESNTAQESKQVQKQEVDNKEELKTENKSVQKFNTDKIQLDKVQNIKYRMQGGVLNTNKTPEVKATELKTQPAAVESKD